MKYYSMDKSADVIFDLDKSESFISEYEKWYYKDEDGESSEGKINNLKGCCGYVEKEIERILESGIKEEQDVIKILAWKTGKVDQDKSNAQRCLICMDGWENNVIQLPYQGRQDISEFAEKVKNLAENYKIGMDPEGILENLNDSLGGIKGIGTVYLITLLYFISKGKFPIYDQFALIALRAIRGGKNIDDIVVFTELPDRKNIVNAFKKYENIYLKLLKDVFGENVIDRYYNKERRLDRALWVYGHLFKYNAKMNLSSYEKWETRKRK